MFTVAWAPVPLCGCVSVVVAAAPVLGAAPDGLLLTAPVPLWGAVAPWVSAVALPATPPVVLEGALAGGVVLDGAEALGGVCCDG